MDFGDYPEFNDKRLIYIYNVLVKNYKFKPEIWINMLKTPEFNVRITAKKLVQMISLQCNFTHKFAQIRCFRV